MIGSAGENIRRRERRGDTKEECADHVQSEKKERIPPENKKAEWRMTYDIC